MPANPDDARARAVEMMARAIATTNATCDQAFENKRCGIGSQDCFCRIWASKAFDALLTAYPQLAAALQPGMVVVPATAAALVEAVEAWAGNCEGHPRDPSDAELLKALATHYGDRTEPCDGCDGDCGEPCAPCSVAAVHRYLDRFFRRVGAQKRRQAGRRHEDRRREGAAAMTAPCACAAVDAYDCFRLRYQHRMDDTEDRWSCDDVEDAGGPCECGCHYTQHEDDEP